MAVPTEIWGLCIAIVCLMIFIVCYRRRFKQKQMQSAKESNVEMVTIDMKPETPVEGTPRSDFEDWPLGVYQFHHNAIVRAEVDVNSPLQGREIRSGQIVTITDVQKDGEVVRGQLRHGSWVTLANQEHDTVFAKKLEPGEKWWEVYKPGLYDIVASAVITETEDRSSERRAEQLVRGDQVEVVQIKCLDDRVRAKLKDGGWISIESTCAKGWIWAKPTEDPPDMYTAKKGEKMFQGLILFNQIWVPAIIFTSDQNGDIFHRAIIRPSEEMVEGGHAGKQLLALPNEHVKIERPISAEEAMNYKEEDFAGRVQPPVPLDGGAKRGKLGRQISISRSIDEKQSSGKPSKGGFFGNGFLCSLTQCGENPYEEDI